MIVSILRIFAIICTALIVGKIVAKVKLPAILGWLITGVVFGPYFECFAGVMIGREIIFHKLAKTGKQIIGITFIQSIGTFLFVTLVFGLLFLWKGIPYKGSCYPDPYSFGSHR